MTSPAVPPITEDDIAQYLANTPEFFERHAPLLTSIVLTSQHGQRAVSLIERQAEMLRDKIKALEAASWRWCAMAARMPPSPPRCSNGAASCWRWPIPRRSLRRCRTGARMV